MKAMVIRAFGGPDVFEQRDLPVPTPRSHEVLVRVPANSLNPVDFKIRETGGGVGVVFDTVGGDLLGRSVGACRPGGRLVGIVNTTGDLNMAFLKNQTVHFLFLQRARSKLEALRGLVERGLLKPLIEAVMPLDKVAEAHRALESGGRRGKLVLKVA